MRFPPTKLTVPVKALALFALALAELVPDNAIAQQALTYTDPPRSVSDIAAILDQEKLVTVVPGMQNGIEDDSNLHVEATKVARDKYHLNSAGYDIVLARTLPQVEGPIAKVK